MRPVSKLRRLLTLFATLASAYPVVSHAENAVSIYGGLGLFNDNAIAESLEDFNDPTDAMIDADKWNVGYRYTYWLNNGFGASLDYYNSGTENSFLDEPRDQLDMTTLSVLGFYRMNERSNLQPYVGAGLGLRSIEQISLGDPDDLESEEAYYHGIPTLSGIGGVNYQLNDNFSVFGELRLDYAGQADSDDSSSSDYTFPSMFSQGLNIGVSLNF